MSDNPTSQEQQVQERRALGFWIYLMTDAILFGALFAMYAALHTNTFGGPSGRDLFDMPYALTETLILLTSSFVCGLAILEARRGVRKMALLWLGATMLLGGMFLAMELHEFAGMINDGNSWKRSGFLSAFFTLVGTHGLHITAGLVWAAVLVTKLARRGITPTNRHQLTLFSMFWHFLDIIWIFIFTIVYLMGVS